METEVIYTDGSMSSFRDDGGSFHDGAVAIHRLRLLAAINALEVNLAGKGWEVTRNGSKAAVVNVIEPLSGIDFHSPSGRLTAKGKRAALQVARDMLAAIEHHAVVVEVEDE